MKHTDGTALQWKKLVFFSNFSKISKFPVLIKRDSISLKKLVFLLKQTIFHQSVEGSPLKMVKIYNFPETG